MKRIEYTAAGVRLLGIFLLVSLLNQSIDFSASAPTNAISSWRPALHFLGFPVISAHTGLVFLFVIKLAVGLILAIYSLQIGKFFWLGILPEIPGGIRNGGKGRRRGEFLGESESDVWSDPL